MNKAIFIDKDGTLIKDVPYNIDIAKMSYFEHSFDGLRMLWNDGYSIFIITNQSGIGRGIFNEDELNAMLQCIASDFLANDVPLAGIYYCPHYPGSKNPAYDKDCFCRKPQPGLLLKAAREHNIDLSRSWMIGDAVTDMHAGKSAGCKVALVHHDHKEEIPDIDVVAVNLYEASQKIKQQERLRNH